MTKTQKAYAMAVNITVYRLLLSRCGVVNPRIYRTMHGA